MRLIVLDANSPWVRSLVQAMPAGDVDVQLLHPHSAGHVLRQGPRRLLGLLGGDKDFVVPGWTRFAGLSTAIATRRVRAAIKHLGGSAADTVVLYTTPFYAGVAERVGVPGAYYCHDPFAFYAGWDAARIADLERRLMTRCNATFAISRALADDLSARKVGGPVFYSPNAAAADWVERCRQAAGAPRPADLPNDGRPVVGCVGQMNRTYDWATLRALAAATPQAWFVFIGPVAEDDPAVLGAIRELEALPNVHMPGPKPHDQLPAYLGAFDVCLNPLEANPHNDRRSPLRLYDYLATDRPVLSTNVREAHEHAGLVTVGRDVDDLRAKLAALLDGTASPVDLASRAAYRAANTWDARARELLEKLQSVLPEGSR